MGGGGGIASRLVVMGPDWAFGRSSLSVVELAWGGRRLLAWVWVD